jgi:hypothetical protein
MRKLISNALGAGKDSSMRNLSSDAKITVERRGQIVLIGINRPQMLNRIDPEAFYGLASACYDFDNDPTLRAAVLFGLGENFSRGNDVEAFPPSPKAGSLSRWVRVNSILWGGRKSSQNHSSPWRTATPGTWGMNSISLPISALRARTSGAARPKTCTAASQASHRSAGQGKSAGQMPCDIC